MGALACITTGFDVIARHPELVLLPILLDLFLWLGPRLSIAPVLQGFEALLSQIASSDLAVPDMAEGYAMAIQLLEQFAQGFNLFSLLNPGPLLGVPVLMSRYLSALTPWGATPSLEVASFLVMLLWIPFLVVIGLGLNALYLSAVGRSVIDETDSQLPGPRAFWMIWAQFLALVLFLAVVFMVALMALSFLSTLVGLLSLTLAGLMMTLASSMMLFVALHLVFTVPGMVLLRRKLFAAIKESLLLTRVDFLNVVFLLGLILLISSGLTVVWSLPEPDSWAASVGLVGHAIVSTALTAALFVFYQERLGYVEDIKKLYAAKEAAATSAIE